MKQRSYDREAFKQIAERVATQLLDDCRAGRISKIGIDEIRAALRAQTECPRGAWAFDALEEMTTRRLVEKVG